MKRDLSKHPIKEAHPWGEDRTWCTRCGDPAWVDDVAFHVWHVGSPFTAANTHCTRPGRLPRAFAALRAALSRSPERATADNDSKGEQ